MGYAMHHLIEYFAEVSTALDERAAIVAAIERAAEALEAEVAAVALNGVVHDCVGFGAGKPPPVLASAALGTDALVVPALGQINVTVVTLGHGTVGTLVVGRASTPFDPEERQIVQTMGQVLGLDLQGRRALAAERARQRLLEALLSIQRAVSQRKPIQEILDTITSGASDLLGDATVALVLGQPDTGGTTVASTYGPHGPERMRDHMAAAASEAISADRVVDHAEGAGIATATIAAPVHASGDVEGALVACCTGSSGRGAEQSELLAAFAQQVSLALTDVRTVEAVREAYRDPLTGLSNRLLFSKRLEQALADAGPEQALAVLFVDLDGFKDVNDSLGHRAGDELLGQVANRIRGCLRSADTAARLGGDEFAVLVEEATGATGGQVAERIAAAIREPFPIADRDVFISASIGVASSQDVPNDPVELLGNADIAMYHARKSGNGRIASFEPRMHTERLERLDLLSNLQQALPGNELALDYQPLVHLATGRIVGMEALLRWTNPHRGSVSPAVFIPVAEETDLIVEIGRWVLWESARQVAQWRQDVPELTLNVNVSARQVVDRGFAAEVAQALAQTGIPAEALTLELTETALISDPETALHRLRELKSLGVGLSVDDFGTGYSSLSYLRQFPVDELKIDRSFTAGIGQDEDSLAVVRTIVELGRTLRLRTVAEGIEDETQLQTLHRLGCELGQGYHFARPLRPDAAATYLAHLDTVTV